MRIALTILTLAFSNVTHAATYDYIFIEHGFDIRAKSYCSKDLSKCLVSAVGKRNNKEIKIRNVDPNALKESISVKIPEGECVIIQKNTSGVELVHPYSQWRTSTVAIFQIPYSGIIYCGVV